MPVLGYPERIPDFSPTWSEAECGVKGYISEPLTGFETLLGVGLMRYNMN
ncbi:hypothetical protein Barb4_04159 [Bacteroidales bacterium Barb4]|nr:hypothetical protein Barb4_04159 [Bacteroidales bacterium Barb4]